ncbi:hypothetical protein ABPG77_003966 [Micractinium sp. CCAP 211/92]
MDGGEAADLAIFISCTALLLGYSLLYFRVATFSVCGKKMMNLYALNKQTRKEWVVLLSQDTKEGINAVQTVRNLIIAVSILAAATASLASTLINLMTDAQKLQQVETYASIDPFSSTLLSPQVKLGIALGLLLLAIMAFAQSVRLAVHVGFAVRVVASSPAQHASLARQTITFMRRSSLYFAIGLRFIYATGPYVLYILGPTSLLIATVLCVAAQVLFDIVPAYSVEEEEEGEEDDGEQAAASGAVKQEHAALQVAPSPS